MLTLSELSRPLSPLRSHLHCILLVTFELQAATGRMRDVQLKYNDDAALTVVLAAKGYPGDYPKGSVIRGLERVKEKGAKV